VCVCVCVCVLGVHVYCVFVVAAATYKILYIYYNTRALQPVATCRHVSISQLLSL